MCVCQVAFAIEQYRWGDPGYTLVICCLVGVCYTWVVGCSADQGLAVIVIGKLWLVVSDGNIKDGNKSIARSV